MGTFLYSTGIFKCPRKADPSYTLFYITLYPLFFITRIYLHSSTLVRSISIFLVINTHLPTCICRPAVYPFHFSFVYPLRLNLHTNLSIWPFLPALSPVSVLHFSSADLPESLYPTLLHPAYSTFSSTRQSAESRFVPCSRDKDSFLSSSSASSRECDSTIRI